MRPSLELNPLLKLMYENKDAKYENETLHLLNENIDYRQFDCILQRIFIPFKAVLRVKIYINQLVLKSCYLSLDNIVFCGNIILKDCHKCKIKDCVFDGSGEMRSSLTVKECDDFTIEHCTFFDNYHSLSIIRTKEIELNDLIFRKSSIGINIKKSEVSISNSNFRNSFMACIKSDKSTIIVEKCTFLDSTMNSINLVNSTYSIQNCKFDQCTGAAIIDKGSCVGNINNNTLGKIFKYAIDIQNKSKVMISNNIINSVEYGILINEHARVTTCDNIISDINYIGIEVNESTSININGDLIDNAGYMGILIHENSSANISNCKIFNTNVNGIAVMNSRLLTKITNTQIMNCKDTAIGAYLQSHVEVFDSHLYNINRFALTTCGYSMMTAKTNMIKKVGIAFVSIDFNGSGIFECNRIERCRKREIGKIQNSIVFNDNSGFRSLQNGDSFLTSKRMISEPISFDPRPVWCCRCNNEKNLIRLECGHFIVCRECAKKEIACPFCRYKLQFNKYYDDELHEDNGTPTPRRVPIDEPMDDICFICYTNRCGNVAVGPCGHRGFCSYCLKKWLQTNKICPMCRAKNAKIVYL